MISYPYFYGNEDLDQDEIFMIFSLDPISENSELNLTQVASLSVLADNVKLELGDEFAYQFCDQISQICGNLRVIPETHTVVLDYNGFCQLVSESDIILDTISSNLAIIKKSSMQQAQNFFSKNNVLVQAGGIQ
jgi:hypothetical protein